MVESGAHDRQELELTVYHNGLALVKDRRRLELPKGTVELHYSEVAKQLVVPSVFLRSVRGFPRALSMTAAANS